ncbi:zinc finger (C3HC4-type RING finger) family protein [Actinidia rufa]|uniref:Zinc finger (C3HC4-type RING finger) family protein n=1 Tax=Actinidia rufa TaxID=165716 RepID=A0A7J0GMG4_9ERIC|nr:zinc finger (C3HC4-type RING finger) family protein [Actinidia rufa]
MSEATSTSASAAAGSSAEEIFRLPTMISVDFNDSTSSTSNVTQAFHFSSGNPRIEETRGIMNPTATTSLCHLLNYLNDGMEDKYCALIRFGDQSSTDTFYKHFNGRHFSSLEVEACHVLFTEHAQTSPASSTEQSTCPVCLERLDQDTSGILTTICNHSVHCSCISKWTDSSCPVSVPIVPAAV